MSEKKRKRPGLRLTPERKKEVKKRLLEERASWSIAYQLGFYVGEQIVDKYLPTLSVDSPKTRKNISVTCAEGDEYRRLEAVWFDKRRSKGFESEKSKATEAEWNALRTYSKMLEDKYLPNTVECHFQLLNITQENMTEFKKGLGFSLWDCDCCNYSIKPEDIDVKADEEGWFTDITLKRG